MHPNNERLVTYGERRDNLGFLKAPARGVGSTCVVKDCLADEALEKMWRRV